MVLRRAPGALVYASCDPMSPSSTRRPPLAILLAVLLPVLLVAGLWLGGHPQHLPGVLRDAFVGDGEEALVRESLDVIDSDYYRQVDETELVNRGLEGAVGSLNDRFSHYFDPKAYQQFSESTSGSFSGVGITVNGQKEGLKVVGLIPRSPAARSGIKPGDLI